MFIIENNRVRPSTFVLTHPVLKLIWDRDESPNKGEAILQYSYIDFLTSPRKQNPYKEYSDAQRPKQLGLELFGSEDYQPDDLMTACIDIRVHQLNEASSTYTAYLAACSARDKLFLYLKDVDLKERTNGGAAVIKPKDVASAITEIANSIKSIKILLAMVNQELDEDVKTRAGRDIQYFENPESLSFLNAPNESAG